MRKLGVSAIGVALLAATCLFGCDRRQVTPAVREAEAVTPAGSATESESAEAPAPSPVAPEGVSFSTSDGGLIHADLYGSGDHAVVLAHGAMFNKESWAAQAPVVAAAGFRVLAIDFRGYGDSRGGEDSTGRRGLYLDILGAVRFLRESGATTVSVVGGSMGGSATARAAVEAEPNQIDRIVLIAHPPIDQPERMQGRKLFIVARDDGSRLISIRKQFESATEPKKLVVLDGSAHAQHIFKTLQGPQLLEEILSFLSEP